MNTRPPKDAERLFEEECRYLEELCRRLPKDIHPDTAREERQCWNQRLQQAAIDMDRISRSEEYQAFVAQQKAFLDWAHAEYAKENGR